MLTTDIIIYNLEVSKDLLHNLHNLETLELVRDVPNLASPITEVINNTEKFKSLGDNLLKLQEQITSRGLLSLLTNDYFNALTKTDISALNLQRAIIESNNPGGSLSLKLAESVFKFVLLPEEIVILTPCHEAGSRRAVAPLLVNKIKKKLF